MNVRPVFTHELGVFWEPIFPFPERHDMSADEKNMFVLYPHNFYRYTYIQIYSFIHGLCLLIHSFIQSHIPPFIMTAR